MKNTINLFKFLAVIIVLTFVARGTSAATLPRVTLTSPQAAEIMVSISGNATVISAGQADIDAPEGLIVKEMLVGIGQKISYGDPVVKFDLSDVQDMLTREIAELDSKYLRLEKFTRDEATDNSSVETAQRNLNRAQSDFNEAKIRVDSLPSVSSASQSLQTAEANVQQAQQAYDNLPVGASDEDIASAGQALADAKAALAQAQETLTAAQKAENDLKLAGERVEDASAALRKAESDYTRALQQANDTSRQNSIDASVLRLDIAKQESKIANLKTLVVTDGILLATEEGIVSFAFDAGRKTDGSAVVKVMDYYAGSKAEMIINANDAIKLSVRDECRVTYGSGMYYRPESTAVVFAIASPDDRDMVKITLLLPDGEWTRGQALDAQIIISRANYGTCVPLSSLHSDSNGYFVYTVLEKSTVLGIENIVGRIPVNLIARDDTNAAIEGPLGRGDYVVIGSSKNIAEGSRVRVE